MAESVSYESYRPAGISESLKLSKDQIESIVQKIDGRILDIGSGSGRLLEMINNYPVEAYGIDIRLAFTDLNRDQGILADANTLPFRQNVFEFVTCLGLLEHLSKPAVRTALKEIGNVMLKNGVLLVVTLNYYSAFVRTANFNRTSHLTYLSKSRLRKTLEDNDFDVELVTNGGKFEGIKLPRIVRVLINRLLPKAMSDRTMVVARKR
jgi:SAM-dependent methyltransferase